MRRISQLNLVSEAQQVLALALTVTCLSTMWVVQAQLPEWQWGFLPAKYILFLFSCHSKFVPGESECVCFRPLNLVCIWEGVCMADDKAENVLHESET